MKKYIKAFFKEIVPVIAGILIALWINNWNENRKDREYVEKVFSSIKEELTATNKEIDEKKKLQQRLIDTINVHLKTDGITLLNTVYKGGGLYVPTIRTNSWKALSNSKIELLDYDKVYLLSNIDEGKELLKMKSQFLMDFIYQNTNETGKDKKELLKLMVQDIFGTQKGIKQEIEKIINE